MDLLIKLHAETPIKPLLTAYPQASSVFLAHRMACVGCSLSDFDTVQEAARNYNLPLEDLLSEIRAVISSPAA